MEMEMLKNDGVVVLKCEGGPDDGASITVATEEIRPGLVSCQARGRYYGCWDGERGTVTLSYVAAPLGPLTLNAISNALEDGINIEEPMYYLEKSGKGVR